MQRMAFLKTQLWILLVVLPSSMARGQANEEQTVLSATAVLNEVMGTPGNEIPASMLANSSGVAIIPKVIKGGFIVGARHGRGLLFVREQDGAWHAPVFITLTGGNIGWQAGVQSSDIILVFKTPKSIQGILSGKLTIGADAAAAAGPVGRNAAVATDGRLQAEIYSYSRSRGLFVGVAIDGSVVQVDQLATGADYRAPAPGQPVVVPPSASQLTQMVAGYANVGAGATPGVPGAPGSVDAAPVVPPNAGQVAGAPQVLPNQSSALAQRYASSEPDILRNQLVQISPELFDLLDDRWKEFLALPPAMHPGGPHPTPESIQPSLDHFHQVATDPRFQQLASRPEFQSVYALLRHYQQSLAAPSPSLQLPPPPPTLSAARPGF